MDYQMETGFSLNISNSKVEIESFLTAGYDSFREENNQVEVLFEGILLNKKRLLHTYASPDFQTLFFELYQQKKEKVIQEFEGDFRGFIWDKNSNIILIFTNPTSTQRVFYGFFEGTFCVDSNLVRFSKNLRRKNIIPKPNINGIYQLLCFTGMLESTTILEGAYKLLDGHYLKFDLASNHFQEFEYFSTFNEPYFSQSKSWAHKMAHEIFSDSVELEYSKDDEYGGNHLALLSGGLDSRVAMMYALQLGFVPDRALCFSQSKYLDETISRKIAEDYHIHYEFIPLDGGYFLKEIDELTKISEGLVFYTGAIHVQHAVKNLQYENFKIFHSGQIGDAVLGSFLSSPKRKSPTEFKVVYNSDFFLNVKDSFLEAIKKYDAEEKFVIRNRGYNRLLLGAHVFQQKAYQTSPFMTKNFLKLSMQLPENWKFNHLFYIEWISQYCPNATKYIWERTMLRPTFAWKTFFGDQIVKRIFVKTHEWILNTPQKSSMYPYQYYFDQSADIQKYYQQYFTENINRIDGFPELKKDVIKLFSQKSFNHKSQAINILSIFKLYTFR